jgi:hypothetical protein
MQRLHLVTIAGLVGALGCGSLSAQTQTKANAAKAGAQPSIASIATIPKPAKKWRTPWGEPDLQGTWSNATTTPLERPAKFGDRAFMTEEEIAAEDKQTTIGRDKRGKRGTDEDVAGAYGAEWWERGLSDGRTSLIYDPPNGKKPPLTEDGKRRAAMRNEGIRTDGPYYGPEDLDLYTRCIVRAPIPRVSSGYDNNFEIVQTPGHVAIVQEQIHETRVIPIASGKNNPPHVNSNVRQWLGDSRGHWEGETLVVETTNFYGRTAFEGASKNMVLVEKWTRVTDDKIDYRFTINDPDTWTAPWSATIAWNKGGTIYEYACHEDNFGLYGILAGARADEKKAAEKK